MLNKQTKIVDLGFISACCTSALLCLSPAQASTETNAKHNPATQNTIPYVLTISGGVSLGAYEAGLNWALVNYFKTEKRRAESQAQSASQWVTPQLSTVTGASAGSINGLLSAISWCVDDSKVTDKSAYHGSVSDNLFKEIWVNVGLDGLLPADPDTYKTSDGLLSRTPFDAPLNTIRNIFKEKIFQPNCSIPLGVTVTGEAPRTIQISGITVNNQRHFIPVMLRADGKQQAEFYSQPVDESNTNYGNVIYLPPATDEAPVSLDYKVNLENVIQAVLASSAFPIAFGRVHLDYCNPSETNNAKTLTQEPLNHTCPKPYAAESGVFVDGGVFDNVPLGSAMALSEEYLQGTQRRLNYIFMDPDNRRQLVTGDSANRTVRQQTATTHASSISYDLLGQIQFLGGAVLTARNYELYKVLTSGDWTNQTFYYTHQLNRYIKRYARDHQLQLTTPDKEDCTGFFSNLPYPANSSPDAKWLSAARYCLMRASQELDFDYQYTPDSSAHLATQRNALADNLAKVAASLDNEHLLRRIQRIKHDPLGDRRILLSSRFFPLTGAYLGAFGAFFDRPFREFDYYVGIYDGINDIVDYACQFRLAQHTDMQCVEGLLSQQLYTAFDLASDANARFVFASIGRLEHPDYQNATSKWHWLASIDIDQVSPQIKMIYAGLNKGFDKNNIVESPEFDDFVAYLKDHHYTSENSSDYFKYIAEKDKDWWVLPAIRSSDRLYELESNAEKESEHKSLLKRPLALTSHIAHYLDDGGKLITFEQPSSISNTSFWRFLPYEIGMRANHERTPYIAWEPTLNILGKELLHFKITPVQKESTKDHSGTLYQVSTLFNVYEHSYFTAAAALDINGSWRERAGYDRVTAGLSISAEIKKKVRLTFGVYDLYDHFAEYNFYLNIGLTDIAGYLK